MANWVCAVVVTLSRLRSTDAVLTMSNDTQHSVLEAVDVTVWRGETLLLDRIQLQAQAGEVTQIAGANGSGKTSVAHRASPRCTRTTNRH